VASPPAKGALTQLYAATSPEAATGNGKVSWLHVMCAVQGLTDRFRQYFIPWARTGEFMGEVVDEETGSKLWAWFEAQVKDL
jgi:retinol dehydrogenase-12